MRILLPEGQAILPSKLVIRLRIPKEDVVGGRRCLRVAAPLIFPATIEERSAAASRHVQSVLPGHSTSQEAAADVMVKKEDTKPVVSRAVSKSFFNYTRAVINKVFSKQRYSACTEKTGMLHNAPLVYLVSRCRLSCHWPCPIA